MSGFVAKGSAFWRQSGLTYLKYLDISTNATRACLKEPVKSRIVTRSVYEYSKITPKGEKTRIVSKAF